MAAVATSRPRSPVWQRDGAGPWPSGDPDEQPVIYRTPHIPLLPTLQPPRAPWLHTAAKFKQRGRFQTENLSEQLSCREVCSYPASCNVFGRNWLGRNRACINHMCNARQAEPLISERSTERATPLSQRLAQQQRVNSKPVAVHQQIKREIQAQVLML